MSQEINSTIRGWEISHCVQQALQLHSLVSQSNY